MITSGNPLVDDRDVELILDELLDLGSLLRLPYFADHDRDTCQMLLESARDLARDVLLPSYRPTDADPPRLVDGKVIVHPQMRELYARLNELGLVAAARPHAVGGSQVPLAVYSMASAYLMAGNLSAYGYLGLTQGAAHLLEAFGDDALKAAYMTKMYSGEWTGTMALTEPQAGSSLADITTTAEPTDAGYYLMRGSKIFISGGDQDITGNIVHMALGRLRGAPAGMKGVSLFCVPKRRLEGGARVDDRGLPPGGRAAEGRRGLIDDRGLPPGGSAAEGRRGLIDRVVVPGGRIERISDYISLLRDLATLTPREALAPFELDDAAYLEVATAWAAALDADPGLRDAIAAGLARL
jgi:hypothetical protein